MQLAQCRFFRSSSGRSVEVKIVNLVPPIARVLEIIAENQTCPTTSNMTFIKQVAAHGSSRIFWRDPQTQAQRTFNWHNLLGFPNSSKTSPLAESFK